MFEVDEITQNDVDTARSLLSSATYSISGNDTLNGIVTDEAASYFAGDKTAGEVAANIQNRAETYVNEQK